MPQHPLRLPSGIFDNVLKLHIQPARGQLGVLAAEIAGAIEQRCHQVHVGLPDLMLIDRVGRICAASLHQITPARQEVRWRAMCLDDDRIGVHLEQLRQKSQVKRKFDDPPLSRSGAIKCAPAPPILLPLPP
eukprot:1645522-Prymnesium_polylepis.1